MAKGGEGTELKTSSRLAAIWIRFSFAHVNVTYMYYDLGVAVAGADNT